MNFFFILLILALVGCGDDGRTGLGGLDGADGKDGKDGSYCVAESLTDSSGYRIVCDGDSAGVAFMLVHRITVLTRRNINIATMFRVVKILIEWSITIGGTATTFNCHSPLGGEACISESLDVRSSRT